MMPHRVKENAEAFGISVESAIRMRTRFLVDIAGQWDEYIDGVTNELPNIALIDAFDEIIKLRAYETRYHKPCKGGITDEMIAAARECPINELVEFTRGKSKCWLHDDNNPSMYHGTRTNTAVCPVCDKKLGPIDVLMTRDGYSFVDAVKQLNAR